MKKIIIAIGIATGLFGCASNAVNYNPAQFSSENYQQNVASSIEYADNFVDFDQRHIPQASLSAEDFSLLLSADVSFNQGVYSQAAGKYYYLANKYQDPRLIYKAIICFEHSSSTAEDYAKLNNLIKQLLVAAPTSNTAHLFGIRIDLEQNNLDKAKQDLNAVIKADPSKTRAVLLFLSTMISSNITSEAKPSLSQFAAYIAKKYSSYPEALLFASIAYSINADQTGLLANLDLINARYPNWEIPTYWSASILAKNNNLPLLTTMITHEMQQTVNPSSTLQNLYIATLVRNESIAVANQYIESELQLKPNDGNMLVNQAIIQYKLGNNPHVINSLLKAESQGVRLDGTLDLALASLYDLNNHNESALQYYQSAGSANPILTTATNIGILRIYFDTNKIQAANQYIENMAKVAKLNPRDSALLKLSIYSEVERYELAYQLAAQNIKLYRTDKTFTYLYASLSGLTGRTEQAIKAYKKYIQLNPNDPVGYNDLGFLLADKTSHYLQAYDYAHKAYSMSPKDPAVLDTLGWANFKLKQYAQAESYIYPAYQQTQDYDTAQHLKQVYLAQGKTADANKVILITPQLQQLQFEQTLADQSMLILMYYQFGLDLAK